jgi:hypothetical protein
VPTTRFTNQEFLNTYSGRKLTVYTNAIESLRTRPIQLKDSYVSAFVKAEKINFSAKADPAPRVIQPRHPRYNASIGVYIKKIEHLIYHKIAKVFRAPTVVKGLNAVELGEVVNRKWKKYTNPVAIGLDASRFDQHTGIEALEWEHSIYQRFYPGDRRLKKLLKQQLRNIGFGNTSDGKIRYKTEGCRMSGDMNTGLGNCLLMCAMVFSYMQDKGFEYDLLNNGDDCTLIFERKYQNRIRDLPEWFLQLGYTMKVEPPVYIMEQIEFCQTHPVFDGHRHVMVRDPRVCLTKDLITLKNVASKGAWQYQIQAIADCGLAAYGNMPIFNEFYNQMNVGGKHKRSSNLEYESGLEWLARRMSVGFSKPTDHARFSFWLAFDITPDEQVAIEQYYHGWKTLRFHPGPVGFYNQPQELYITRPEYLR